MQSIELLVPAALLFGTAALLSGSCTFPDFTVVESATSSTTSAAAASGGHGGAGAIGGAASSTGGTAEGSGGIAGNPNPGCMGAGGFGGEMLCDADTDDAWKLEAPCCAQPVDADCDDTNDLVFPGQSVFSDVPIPNKPASEDFDYNCDGDEQPDPIQLFGGNGDLACGEVTNCLGSKQGFSLTANCGFDTEYYQCQLLANLCDAVPVPSQKGKLRCR